MRTMQRARLYNIPQIDRAFTLVIIAYFAFLLECAGESFAGAKINGRWVTP